MKDVVIVSAVRTPIGSFGGQFVNESPINLGLTAVKGALSKSGVKPDDVNQVIIGNVLSSGHGQNVARQIQIKAGIPQESTAYTVSKVCGSGLQSVILGAQSILTGDNDVVVVGGTESMSTAAYVSDSGRWGSKMGNTTMKDTIISDGLTDAFENIHMGITAENIAAELSLSRAEQDEFALQSQIRACSAIESGRFKNEIVEHIVKSRRKEIVCDTDEFPRQNSTLEGLAKLRAAFQKDGTVTAGNSSGINDGAAALVLMSAEKAKELGLTPMARIVSYASAGVDPSKMGYGPIPASQKALDKAGITVSDLDLVEANEAFAAQAIAVTKGLSLDSEKTNVNGGAIALGHPVGASGARILVTLLHELEKRQGKFGLATLCVGGGQGVSVIVENLTQA